MSIEKKASAVVEQAKDLASRVKSWADFSNGLYAPGGIVATAFPDERQREAFYDSDHGKEIEKILSSLMSKFGIIDGAAPSEQNDKLGVRIPKTVHHVGES